MPRTEKVLKRSHGFTIVELLVVIVTIVILVAIAVTSYGDWQTRMATNGLKSDLEIAATAMNNELRFKNAYPTGSTLPTSYTPGSDTTISRANTATYPVSSTTTFCLNGVSKKRSAVQYYISSTMGQPSTGQCP